MQSTIQKSNKLWLWIVFIIYPLGSFIYALKHYSVKGYRVFILLFFAFYGLTFLPIPNSDGSRYKEGFTYTREYTLSQYYSDVLEVFSGESDNPDFYAITLKFVVHSFTSDVKIYFMIAALVYFFVFLKLMETIWNLTFKAQTKFYIGFFIGCFFIYNISAGVNSIRFPLAFMVFAYGALNLLIKRERKYLIIAFLSILIHFSFLFSSVILLLGYLFRFKVNGRLLYFLLLMVFVFSSLLPSFIADNISVLGKVSEVKFEAYTQEGFQETRTNHLQVWNWYVYFNFYATYIFTVVALLVTRFKLYGVKFDAIAEKLFVFSMIMLMHAMLSGSVVDVISNRFNLLFSFFTLIYLLYLSSINYGNKLLAILHYIYIPILIINLLVKFRGDMSTINAVAVFGNFIVAFFADISVSITDLLF